MPLSRSIEKLLALAAEASLADDDALDLLARHVLSALLDDPKTPENIRTAAVRMLRKTDHEPTVAEARMPDEAPD
jgi:uncharacterized protein (UPF0147 family)